MLHLVLYWLLNKLLLHPTRKLCFHSPHWIIRFSHVAYLSTSGIMEDARGNPTPSVNGTCQQPAKNIAWADGHWGIYGSVNTHVCKMHAGLLHLLSPDAFSELKMVTNALMVRFLPRTPLESLQLNLGDRRGRGKGEEGNGSGEGVKMEALERCRDGWKRGRIGRKYNIKSVNYSKAMQTVSACGF